MTNEIIIILICFICYVRAVRFQLVVDEITRHRNNLSVNANLISWIDSFLYSGGFIKTLWLDRLITITLYTTVCVFIYWAFGANNLSFVTAILYCLNPINNQIAVWNNGRRYLFVIIITLGMMIKSWAAIFYLLIPYLQVIGLLTPLLLFKNTVLAFIIVVILTLITLKTNVFGQFKKRFSKIPKGERTAIHFKKIVVCIKTIGFYFWNTLLPTNKFFYYSYLQNFANTEEGNKNAYSINKEFWLSLLTVIALISLSIYYWNTPISYGIIWWFIFIFQWSNIITVTQTLADRYCSLPAIFLMYALAYLIQDNMIVFIAISTAYLLGTQKTIKQYNNGDTFFEYHLFYQPDNIESRQYLSIELIKQGDLIRALTVSKEGLAHHPTDFRLNVLVANCLKVLNRRESVSYINTAEKNMYLGDEKNFNITMKNLKN